VFLEDASFSLLQTHLCLLAMALQSLGSGSTTASATHVTLEQVRSCTKYNMLAPKHCHVYHTVSKLS